MNPESQVAAEPFIPSKPMAMLAGLLKAPASVAAAIAGDKGAPNTIALLLVFAGLFHAFFGFAVGLFGGWPVAGVAALKSAAIAYASLVICLPSLYVFSAVGGAYLSFRQTLMLGSAALAMVGILLIGLAPVAWLFSVSTASLPFMVVLTLMIWFTALMFAIRFTGELRAHEGFQRPGGITAWFIVYVLVSFQMTTCLRPILTRTEPGQGWITGQKQFFLAHFDSCFGYQK
ncbi:MAG: hypothetical protein K1X53_02035 [Candidatus Sumerlaeaceae bacterium]|nr:hypothetical protein [Candidatus Sumerlaeaceae bacterium]